MVSIIQGPDQAKRVYGAAGAPRQRHVFMVRFIGRTKVEPLTFVVKHCDRPKVTVKTEELNQYNKRRQVYTGFKLEPIKMTFYDSADGAAQNMWIDYSRYYFGDFVAGSETAFSHDVVSKEFRPGNGFGLTESYMLPTASSGETDDDAQWFFKHIEIYHFYVSGGLHLYDQYTLYNPRITAFEPDELDYENGNVSQVSMQLVYENLQYNAGKKVSGGAFNEFEAGQFFGAPAGTPDSSSASSTADTSQVSPIRSAPPSIFNPSAPGTPDVAGYRRDNTNAAGALASQGSFSFGAITQTAMNIGASAYDAINSGVAAVAGAYGTASNAIAQGLVAAGGAITNTAQGITLPASVLASINAQQGGAAQYGFNAGSAQIDPNAFVHDLSSGQTSTIADAPTVP